jgi:hypothetical protein
MDIANIAKLIDETNKTLVEFSDSDIMPNVQERIPNIIQSSQCQSYDQSHGQMQEQHHVVSSPTSNTVLESRHSIVDSLDSSDVPVTVSQTEDIGSFTRNTDIAQIQSPASQHIPKGPRSSHIPLQRPSQPRLQRPSQNQSDRPSQNQLQRPSQNQLQRPSQNQLQRPSQNQSERPSQNQLQRPSQNQLQRPSQNQLQRPSQNQSERPSQNQLQRPSQNQLQRPSQMSSHSVGDNIHDTNTQHIETIHNYTGDQKDMQPMQPMQPNDSTGNEITHIDQAHTLNELPDHMTSLMGYSIPTTTLYLILVLLIAATGIYFMTSSSSAKKNANKNKKDDGDSEDD